MKIVGAQSHPSELGEQQLLFLPIRKSIHAVAQNPKKGASPGGSVFKLEENDR